MPIWSVPGGSACGVQGVLTFPLLEGGDLVNKNGFPAPSTRLTAIWTWPVGRNSAFMLESGLQGYRQAPSNFYGFTRAAAEGEPIAAIRNQFLFGLWGGWAFGGPVR